jgi:LysM repeat protein
MLNNIIMKKPFLFVFAGTLLFAVSCDTLKKSTKGGPETAAGVKPAQYSVTGDRNLDYVVNFRNAAIQEMEQGGIPASIILAQGILESGAGSSDLAVTANNHFGIKCGGSWNGRTYYKKDDDRNNNGEIIESCFRRYNTVFESYHDHGEFLRDPRKHNRYGFLFNLDKTDYKGWARGLQSAGYATSPTYANQLINLIERYQLHQYDRSSSAGTPVNPPINNGGSTGNGNNNNLPVITPNGPSTAPAQRIGRVNDVKVVLSAPGETLQDIARLYNLSTEKVVEYNDRGYPPGFRLRDNTRIYIQRKRDRWHGRSTFHYVREDQTMFDIAQLYGICLSDLLSRNKLSRGQEPKMNEKIRLKGTRKSGENIQLRDTNTDPGRINNNPVRPADEDLPFEIGTNPPAGNQPGTNNPPANPNPSGTRPSTTGVPYPGETTGNNSGTTGNTNKPTTPTTKPNNPQPSWPGSNPNPTQPTRPTIPPTTPPVTPAPTNPTPTTPGTPAPANGMHLVVKGDTLFNISRRYGITVAQLKQMNNMADDTIKIGQYLRVK